jgi:predicted RNA binding protein YcfA (HicA-like mRNA interferase family)
MHNKINFKQLEKLLKSLNFEIVKGSHYVFKNDKHGSIVITRSFRTNEIIPLNLLSNIRKSLSSKGVISEVEFDKKLEEL